MGSQRSYVRTWGEPGNETTSSIVVYNKHKSACTSKLHTSIKVNV